MERCIKVPQEGHSGERGIIPSSTNKKDAMSWSWPLQQTVVPGAAAAAVAHREKQQIRARRKLAIFFIIVVLSFDVVNGLCVIKTFCGIDLS